MPLLSNCISELLHAANRIHQLPQDELRHKLDVAVTVIGRALEKSEVRHLPRVVEAESYLRSVCASAQELHAEDAKAAFLYAVEIIQILRKHASEED